MMNNFYPIRSYQPKRSICLTVVAALFMAGCASTPTTPAPTGQMSISRAAVSEAISAGGNEFAPLQIKSAMDKMNGAEQAMTANNYVLASRLAEEAQVDAQLAETMARSAKAQKAAEALRESNRVLRQEIDRKNP